MDSNRSGHLCTIILLASLVVLGACAPASDDEADLLIVNGRVYTLTWDEPLPDGAIAPNAPHDENGWHPDAEAVAVTDGIIVFVGTTADAEAYRGRTTQVIDASGATVVPGFVDSHVHIAELGRLEVQVNLLDVHTEEEAIQRTINKVGDVTPGEWIIGWGWDEGEWANRYPTADRLSEAFPDNPVVLRSLHGFAVWGNRMALDAAGISADTEEISGGRILRNADGSPSGVLLNRATPLLIGAIPAETPEQTKAYVLAGLTKMAKDGYVAIHEAGAGTNIMAAFEALEAEGKLPTRVNAMLRSRDEALCRRWLEKGPSSDNPMLAVRTVKAFYDGALGSRGARLIEDYSDRPEHRGVSGSTYGFDEVLVGEMMQAGFQVGIHAIGDAGNRETLDFIESQIVIDSATRELRHRIEHAQVVHPDDFIRFKNDRIIAAMQPPHCVEDMPWAEDRLGPERVKGAYAWRTLRTLEVPLAFGSDLTGSDHNVFYGLHSAITRQNKDHQPPGGWYPEQSMTAEEALRGYTSWNAFAAHWEHLTGKLQPGMWADISVVDIDSLVVGETEPGRLLDGKVLATVVAGKVVFQAK
ncbi:MAG: amidohydrolase family protein [bacterium]|nr:amidohydrolase family protein [bacterium]